VHGAKAWKGSRTAVMKSDEDFIPSLSSRNEGIVGENHTRHGNTSEVTWYSDRTTFERDPLSLVFGFETFEENANEIGPPDGCTRHIRRPSMQAG
jgi:hypothetical protein